MRNKKILMLIPSMGSGGAERVMATLANKLSQSDYNVIILTLKSSESFYPLNKEVKSISAGVNINRNNKLLSILNMIFYGVKSIFYFKSQIKKQKPDIIISFLTHTNIIALIIKIFFNRKTPLIISERAEPENRPLITRIITKYFYQFSDVLVCQSNKIANFFNVSNQNKIKVIKNPIAEEAIILKEPKVRRKAIIGIGRLFPQKNFSLLINSFNLIKKEFPDHVLEIYGEGYLRDELQTEINKLNLENRVFLEGRKMKVMNYVYDAQLFVLSSNFEGFPNALIECMANGLPVISTDFSSGVAKELIKQNNGLLVTVGDVKELSNGMRYILSDEKIQIKMSESNKKLREELSSEKIVNQWIKLFEKLTIKEKL